MKKFYFKISLFYLLAIGLSAAQKADAIANWWPIVPCGTSVNPAPCQLCHLWQLASNVFNLIVWGLAVPIATLLFMYAGVMLLISGGDESKVTKAREIFTTTVIGVIIVFCSWLLVDTIFKTLATNEFVGAWSNFPACGE